MIEFNKVSNESYFIKNLLYNTFLPLLRTVRENDYIIRDRLYIYKCNVIRCTSSGYIPVKNTNMDINQYPESLLRKTDDEKVRVGQVYYATVNDSIRKIVGARGDTRSPIAEGWYEENIASYDIIGDYYFGENNDKFCRNFLSSSEGYDYKTHEKLGQYLRGLRDMYGLNLLPLYNCFSNQLLKNIHITNKSVERTSQDYSTKVYKVPIRFNTDYTICMDNVGMTTFAPAFIHHGTLMKLNNNRFGNSVDVTNKYIKLNHNDVIHNEPNLRFKNPIKLRFNNVPKNKVINYSEVTYTEIPSKYISKYYRLNSAADPAYVKREVDDAYMSIDYNNPLLEGHKNYIKGYEFIPGDFDSGLTPSDSLYPDDNLIMPMGGFKIANITEDDFVGNEENYFLYDSSTFSYEQCQSGDTFDSEARYFYRSEVYESINPSIGTFEQISKSYKKCPEDETLFNETIFNNNKTKYYTISNTVIPGETVTNTGDVVSFNSTTNETCEKLVASIEPIQDLHGYDAPWVGGAGKNKFHFTAGRSAYTWNDGFGFSAINVDDDGVTLNGTATSAHSFSVTGATLTLASGTYRVTTQSLNLGLTVLNGSTVIATGYGGSGMSFTLSEQTEVGFSITCANGASFNNQFVGFQIEEGSTASAWTPYENICPISGHTEVDVNVCGVNVWDEKWELGNIYSSTGQNGDSTTAFRSKNYIPIIPNTQYYCKIPTTIGLRWYRADKTYIEAQGVSTSSVVTSPSDAYYLRFIIGLTTYNNDISINYPATDHEYHAYNGQTYTTSLGTTVYGGSDELVSGNGTSTLESVSLNGSSTPAFSEVSAQTTADGTKYVAFINSSSYATASAKAYSDKYKWVDAPLTNLHVGEFNTRGSYIRFVLADQSLDTLAKLNADLANNSIQLVYTKKTADSFTTTPTQVQTLLGTNNVWADSGDIEITHTPYTNNIIYVQCTQSSVYDPDEIYYYVDKEKDEGWYEFIDGEFTKTEDTYINTTFYKCSSDFNEEEYNKNKIKYYTYDDLNDEYIQCTNEDEFSNNVEYYYKDTKTYYKKEMTEVPVTFNYDITEDNCCMYDYIEDELYLLIQVPSVFDSNIVILEGDYTNIVKEKYYDPTKFELFSNSKLDYLFTKDLILMETNTKKLRPFSPTLIQFLLWNVICNLDTINNDLDRLYIALDTITDLVPDPQYTQNYWYDRYREAIFNYANEFPRKYIRDNLGYVTKDIERIIYQGVDFIEATDDLTNPEVYPEDMD